MSDVTAAEKTLEFTEAGLAEFERMANHAQNMGGATAESFAKAVGNMARLGGKVFRDGDKSLYVNSFIAYGVVWFADDRENKDGAGTWGVHS